MLQVEQKRRTWYKGRINVKVFEWRGNIFCNVKKTTDLQTLGEFPHGDPFTAKQQLLHTRAGGRGIQKNPRPKALSCTKSTATTKPAHSALIPSTLAPPHR